MSKYTVEVLPAVYKQIKQFPKKEQEKILTAIERLEVNPRPRGYKALKGKLKGTLRIDVGNYRILYQIFDKQLFVLVVKAGDRKNVYD
jgi:mRNA interferase RelE/StbE